MSRKNFIIILFISVVLSFFAGFKCKKISDQLDDIGKPSMPVVILNNDSLHETIYLVSKHWGLTGDHSIIALTKNDPKNEWYPDSIQDIIFKGGSVFYNQNSDTIKIWTDLMPDKSSHLITRQKIDLIGIDNPTAMKYREQINTSIKLIE